MALAAGLIKGRVGTRITDTTKEVMMLSLLWPAMLFSGLSDAAAPQHARPTGGREGAPAQRIAGSISDADYPALAIQLHQQGVTRVRIGISASGGVKDCSVVAPSGSDVLDATTCAIIRARFRYIPAHDLSGRGRESTQLQSVAWRLPAAAANPLVATAFGAWELRVTTVADDLGMRCAVESIDAPQAIADASCPPAVRVPRAEIGANAQGLMLVTRLSPEGNSTPRRPLAGTLIGQAASDIEVLPDGSIGSCHDVALPAGQGGSMPSLCAGATQSATQFAPDPQGRTRRGRIQIEFYSLNSSQT